MVRSRNLGSTLIPQPRARRLEQVGLARLAPIDCRSRVNLRSVAAASFETGATRCLCLGKAHLFAPSSEAVNLSLRPHPEEPERSEGVSKDGHESEPNLPPWFETAR